METDMKTEYKGQDHVNNSGSDLARQVTISLSSEQYERMFFSPNQPKNIELQKRFGNPTLLGLLGFLIPYSSTIFILCQFGGAVPPTSLIDLTGTYYFIGGIAMILAGIAEFILGNTFPFAVFIVYGAHWCSLGYAQDPSIGLVNGFAKAGGSAGIEYNSAEGFKNIALVLTSFIFFVGTFRVNVFFTITFLGLIFLFSFIAAADFAAPHATTAAEGAHILYLLKIGGSFGMLGVVCGWYLALLTVCEAVGLPCPLPVLDLSSRVFPQKKPQKDHEV